VACSGRTPTVATDAAERTDLSYEILGSQFEELAHTMPAHCGRHRHQPPVTLEEQVIDVDNCQESYCARERHSLVLQHRVAPSCATIDRKLNRSESPAFTEKPTLEPLRMYDWEYPC
jgi:hypothetical protein